METYIHSFSAPYKEDRSIVDGDSWMMCLGRQDSKNWAPSLEKIPIFCAQIDTGYFFMSNIDFLFFW